MYCDLVHAYCDLAYAYCDLAHAYCDLAHAYCDLAHTYLISCLLDEGIPKIWKKLNSHGGFLRADQGRAKMCCQMG